MCSDSSIDLLANDTVSSPKNLPDESTNADPVSNIISSNEASSSGQGRSTNVLDAAQPRVNLLKKPISQSLQCKLY